MAFAGSFALAARALWAADGAAAAEVEIEIVGSRPIEAPPKERFVAGSVIERERLQQPGTDTAQALRESPGVQITQMGGLGSPATASIRGATAAQTPVYLAGIRINDEVGGAANLADVPVFLLDRIEIYRSHAPGSAAQFGIGGALFAEPRRPDGNQLSAGATVGSYGVRSAQAWASFGAEGRGVLAGFDVTAADNDYPFLDTRGTLYRADDDAEARLPNADAQISNVWILARHDIGRAWLSLVFNQADREQGAPKLAVVPSRHARLRNSRKLVAIKAEVPVDAWEGGLQALTSVIASENRIDDPAGELSSQSPRTRTPGQRLEQSLTAHQTTANGGRFEQRLGFALDRLQRYEQQTLVERQRVAAERVDQSLTLSASLPVLGRFRLQSAVQGQCFGASGTRLEACSSFEPSGRLGASYQQPSYELYTNAGRYVRLATLTELYGASLLVRGNERLLPERGSALEFGGRCQYEVAGTRRLWADVSLFARWSEQLISYLRTAQGYMVPQNTGRGRFLGAELAAGAAPVAQLELSGNVSLLDPRDTSEARRLQNDVLPFRSQLSAALLATLHADLPSEALGRGALTARYVYQSSSFSDPAGLGVIPEQGSLDIEASSKLFADALSVRLRVSNLLDAERFDIVGFPLPGRSFFASIEASQ